MAELRPQSIAARAQRLWALERTVARPGLDDAFRFVNAIAVLDEKGVRIGFVRSSCAHGSTEECLVTQRVRVSIERSAPAFSSLDAAMAWAECRKIEWLSQGWTEWYPNHRDR